MTTLAQTKIIREYSLPCDQQTVAFELTGEWQILRVDARFAMPNLYVLEDTTGKKTRVEFSVVATNVPVPAGIVSGDKAFLGSYLVHVPTNVLHVFGPTSGKSLPK